MSAQPLRVVVRVRPEEEHRRGRCVRMKSKTDVTVEAPSRRGARGADVLGGALQRHFKFDQVFGPSTRQAEVYAAVEPLVVAASEGYNATVFAYGCTGSGKTHTMAGDDDGIGASSSSSSAAAATADPTTDRSEGIIPRAVRRFFELVQIKAEEQSDRIFLVRLTFVELYNDRFRDLLSAASSPSSRHSGIQLRERASGEVFLEGSSTLGKAVTSAAEAMKLYRRGTKQRATAATDLNQSSSRSHAIFTLQMESRSASSAAMPSPLKKSGSANCVLRGRLHMIDLAGSERLKKSNARGSTRAETLSINRSLATLGDVLSALSKRSRVTQQFEAQRSARRRRYAKQRRGGNGEGNEGGETSALAPAPGSSSSSGSGSGSGASAGDGATGATDEDGGENDPAHYAANGRESTTSLVVAGGAAHAPEPLALAAMPLVPYRNSKLTYLLKNSLGGNCITLMVATVRSPTEFHHSTLMTLKYAAFMTVRFIVCESC